MAVVDSIYGASGECEERLLELKSVLEMVLDAVGDGAVPAWLFTIQRHVDSVDSAFRGFVDVVHEEAMPRIKDLEAARRQMGVKSAIQA